MTTKSKYRETKKRRLQTQRGALFSIGDANPALVPFCFALADEGKLSARVAEFVQALFDVCGNESVCTTDVACLIQTLGVSRSTLLNRCLALVGTGLMKKTLQANARTRSVTVYTLYFTEQLSTSVPEQGELDFSVARDNCVLATDSYDPAASPECVIKGMHVHVSSALGIISESLSIYVLAATLPSSTSGKYTKNSYNVPIRIGNENLHVEVRPTRNTKVATVLDLRVLIGIVSLAYRGSCERLYTRNPFVLEVDSILNLFRDENYDYYGGSFKRYILSSIERWASTGFTVVSATPGVLEQYGPRLKLKKEFRLIRNATFFTSTGTKRNALDCIELTLDEDLLACVSDPDVKFLQSIHVDSLRERSPLALRFHIWCRWRIRNDRSPREWLGKCLHREIEPLRSVKKFRADIKKMFNDRIDEDRDYAYLAGYGFRLVSTPTKWAYEIWAE